jgi:hypothetical protein
MNDAVMLGTFAGGAMVGTGSATGLKALVRFGDGVAGAEDCASALRFFGGRAIVRMKARSLSI